MCVVVLPIGLSCPVKFVVCHSRDRDTRWAFCYSRGRGVGMLKWQTSGFPLQAGGTAWTRGSVPLAKRGEPNGGGQFINSERAIGIKH